MGSQCARARSVLLPLGRSLRTNRHHCGLREAEKGTLESRLDWTQWRPAGGEMELGRPLPMVVG